MTKEPCPHKRISPRGIHIGGLWKDLCLDCGEALEKSTVDKRRPWLPPERFRMIKITTTTTRILTDEEYKQWLEMIVPIYPKETVDSLVKTNSGIWSDSNAVTIINAEKILGTQVGHS